VTSLLFSLGISLISPALLKNYPLNPQHRTNNQNAKGREMSLSSARGDTSFFNGTNSFNNNSFNNVYNVNNFSLPDERAEIVAWLSPLEPRVRHEDIRAHRVKHVGDWLLRTEEYQDWFRSIRGGESDNSVLFCYGDPGVGKTYIT